MSNQTNNKLSIERIEQYANDKRMCNVNDEILEMARRLLSAEAELQEYRKASNEPVAWLNEDELPENYPYDQMFPFSKVDIVRLFPVYAPQPAPPLQAVTVSTKEHELRELVNDLRDVAVKYRDTQQLREHIAKALRAAATQQ